MGDPVRAVVAHGASARRRRGRRHPRGRPVRAARRKGAHLAGRGRRGTPPVGVASPGAPRAAASSSGRRAALYASESFDGLLRPVVSLPADVADVSFGLAGGAGAGRVGRALDDRARERQASARVTCGPPRGGRARRRARRGAGRGRAAARVDRRGRALDGRDRPAACAGEARLRGANADDARRLALGRDARRWRRSALLAGGRLAAFDALPAADPPPVAARRSNRRGARTSRHCAAPCGRARRRATARRSSSRAATSCRSTSSPGPCRSWPRASCPRTRRARRPGRRTTSCSRALARTAASFVVAHALDRAPVVEQTFADGGPLRRERRRRHPLDGRRATSLSAGPRRVACVRLAGRRLAAVRPRRDRRRGHVGPDLQRRALDPARGRRRDRGRRGHRRRRQRMGPGRRAHGRAARVADGRADAGHAFRAAERTTGARGLPWIRRRLADRAWTVTPQGTLRGWAALGSAIGAVEIGVDGSLQTSPFTFERISSAGAIALARTREGRIWQTLDRGATWTEVAAPPAARPGGWIDPARVLARRLRSGPVVPASAGLRPRRPSRPRRSPRRPRRASTGRPCPSMTCRAGGGRRSAPAASSDERSPDDLGLGASKVAVADAKGDHRLRAPRLPAAHRRCGPRHRCLRTPPRRARSFTARRRSRATTDWSSRASTTTRCRSCGRSRSSRRSTPRGPCGAGRSRCATSSPRARVAGAGGDPARRPGAQRRRSRNPRDAAAAGRSPRPDCRRRCVAPARRHDPRVEATRRVRGGARRGVAHRQRCSHRRRRRGVAGGGLVGTRPRSAPGVHGRAGHGVRARRAARRPTSIRPTSTRSRSDPGASWRSCARPSGRRAAVGHGPRRIARRRRACGAPRCRGRRLQRPTIRPAKRTAQAGA